MLQDRASRGRNKALTLIATPVSKTGLAPPTCEMPARQGMNTVLCYGGVFSATSQKLTARRDNTPRHTRLWHVRRLCLFCNSGCTSTYYSISSKRLGPAENGHTALAQDKTPRVPVSVTSRHAAPPVVLRLLRSPGPS